MNLQGTKRVKTFELIPSRVLDFTYGFMTGAAIIIIFQIVLALSFRYIISG